MSALTTDATILGNGLGRNVRSYMLEKTVDFSTVSLGSTAYYEIGAFPAGFVPRNIAIVELRKASSSSTVKVYKKSDSSEVASLSVGGATLGFAAKPFDAATVASSAATITPSTGATLALKFGAAFTDGAVKIVVSGDFMTGVWDEGEKSLPVRPDAAVATNAFSAGEHNLS